jgi:hypothetical protein
MCTFDVTKTGQEPNLSSFAVSVGLQSLIFARIVGLKPLLFVALGATVCEPLVRHEVA